MEKSIEKIWNDAFIDENALITPKINDLYNQKSKSIIAKIKRTYEIDNKGLIPIAIISVIITAFNDKLIIGLYGAFLIMCLYFFNRSLLSKFKHIDIKSDNLTYLKSYKEVINSVMKATKKMFLFAIPIAVMSIFGLDFFLKEFSFLSKFITEDHTTLQIVGILLLMSVCLTAFVTIVYAVTTKLVYGRLISKLDEIIKEIENLK